MREIWEAADALSKLGFWVRISSRGRRLTVIRDGKVIGTLRFPRER